MKITTLVENTTKCSNLGYEHGLSLSIEAAGRTILFDTGASDVFARNAEILGVDLTSVDAAVLSHGHYDHSGGLKTFFAMNKHAPLYVRKDAFGPYYSERNPGEYHYIGVDQSLIGSNRFLFTSAYTPISGGITLFSKVEGTDSIPSGNKSLYRKEEETYKVDNFSHEQYLSIQEGEVRLLVSGCSHRGILNIVEAYHEHWGLYPTHVIGGFHLYNHRTGEPEAPQVLEHIAKKLLESKAVYYTCHCTGEENFLALERLMGDRIHYLAGGDILQLGKEDRHESECNQ